MSTNTEALSLPDLPTFPQARPARCPFDPPEDYRDWQQEQGLQLIRLWNGKTAWAVTRYEDIRAALSDPRVSADATHPRMPRLSPVHETITREDNTFIRMDDPEHAQLRKMVTRSFTVKQAEAMRPDIQKLVDERLDQMIRKGQPADLVAEFALPVPSTVIAMLLGVPHTDRAFFQEHSSNQLSMALPAEQARASRHAFSEYLRDLVARKEREPGDDLISRLLDERVATGELTREQLVQMARLLLMAGHETSANMIALGTLTLLRNPDQLALLRDTGDRAVVADVVEELLRYLSIVENNIRRVAREDLTIGGQLVRAGEGLLISLPSGNRDTSFLADDPDRFDIKHNARAHIAFGYGVHQCLGQNLARVELQVALPALLHRLPGLRLAVPFEDVPFRQQMSIYGVTELPVGW
jgi:cytochrome P450